MPVATCQIKRYDIEQVWIRNTDKRREREKEKKEGERERIYFSNIQIVQNIFDHMFQYFVPCPKNKI